MLVLSNRPSIILYFLLTFKALYHIRLTKQSKEHRLYESVVNQRDRLEKDRTQNESQTHRPIPQERDQQEGFPLSGPVTVGSDEEEEDSGEEGEEYLWPGV